MSYFILIFTILFILLSIKRLDWALVLLFFLLPSYLVRFNFVVPMTLLEVMILTVFVVWLAKSKSQIFENLKNKLSSRGNKISLDYPFKWEMIILLIISFVAVGVAGITTEALGVWKAYFFEPLLLFIVVFNVFGKDETSVVKKLEKIIWPLALSALVISLFAVYQKITGQFIPNQLWSAEATRRVTSVFGYPNAVGLYVESIIFLSLGLLFFVIARSKATWQSQVGSIKQEFSNSKVDNNKPEIATPGSKSGAKGAHNDRENFFNFQAIFKQFSILKFSILFLSIILSLLSIVFAKSVGASLGVGAGLVVFALLYGKKIRLITLSIIILVTIGIASYQPTRQQALKYLTLNDFSGQVRKAQWKETWQMLSDGRLVTGAGLSNYQKTIAPYHIPGIFVKDFNDPAAQRKLVFNETYRKAHWQPLEIYLYPHNIILNFWTELGLLGMVLFVWLIGKYFYFGLKLLFCVTPVPSQAEDKPSAGIHPRETEELLEKKFLVIGLISAMVAIVIHGLVDVPYFKNDLAVLFWLLFAMMGLLNFDNLLKKKS